MGAAWPQGCLLGVLGDKPAARVCLCGLCWSGRNVAEGKVGLGQGLLWLLQEGCGDTVTPTRARLLRSGVQGHSGVCAVL